MTTKAAKITGLLRLHVRGFGFVKPDPSSPVAEEIFIPKTHVDNGVDGDLVEVALLPPSGKGKGPEGKIVAILKRGRSQLGATLFHFDTEGNAYAYAPLLGPGRPLLIPMDDIPSCKRGDRLLVKILNWGDRQTPPLCRVLKVIGPISDASLDSEAALAEFDLRGSFPREVVQEVKKWQQSQPGQELKERKDLTHLTTLTIDPKTARDFDDALSLTVDKKGNFQLGVHIADVSAYVKKGSALDKEAELRGNSLYFPGECTPMLPPKLSEELCSLKPKVVRLTLSVLMDFTPEGKLIHYTVLRSAIRSRKRFTYEEAKEVLDGKLKSPYKKDLDALVKLCLLLKERRSLRGSIDFALPDLVIDVDKMGEPQGVYTVEYDITHQLVEECMLKANEIVAQELSRRGIHLLFRIHEQPESASMEEFASLARLLGFSVPKKPSLKEIQELFEKAKKTPHAHRLSVAFIRSMKLAFYSPENVGHYGLALDHYCHFTSPIRRYSDLVIHRLLFEKPLEEKRLKEIALKCSDQERVSMRAEMHVKRLKKLRLLKQWKEAAPKRSYEAIVTRVAPVGLTLEIPALFLDAFLHISELEDDYFEFNPASSQLLGRHSGIRHKIGDQLMLFADHIDLIQQEVTWRLSSTRPRRRR